MAGKSGDGGEGGVTLCAQIRIGKKTLFYEKLLHR